MTQLTRKAANARVLQLEEQLRAANGETRKNMRTRLARTTEELGKARELLKSATTVMAEGTSYRIEIEKFLTKPDPLAEATPPPA